MGIWSKKRVSASIAVLVGVFCAAACHGETPLEPRSRAVPGGAGAAGRCLVEYEVRWQGAQDACVVLPPSLTAPDWGQAELISTRTEQDGDGWKVVQTVAYTSSKPGRYTVPAVEVEAITENQPIVGGFSATPTTRLKMEPVEVTFTAARSAWALWGAAAGVVLLMAGAAAWLLARRRRGTSGVPEGADAVSAVRELLHGARRSRRDGELYACYQSLFRAGELLETVNVEAKPVTDALRSRTPAVGFQGLRPSDDETDGYFRDLERILARCNSAPAAQQETS